ncbi:MAG: hypothetical protein AAFX10_16505, partial [Pseudomonadota bacterium]
MTFMRQVPTSITRGVGRRILSLFLIAGILPVMITTGLSYYEHSRASYAESARTLRGNAQRYGSEILMRLDDALRKADHIGERYQQTSAFRLEEHAYMLENVDAVWLSSTDKPIQVAYGRPSESMLSILPDRAYLAPGNVQLHVDGGGDEVDIVLLRTLKIDDGTFQTLGLALNVEALLGPRERSAFDADYCVFAAATGQSLFCTDERRRPDRLHIAELADQGGAIPSIEWTHSGVPQLAAIWKLSLSRVVRGPALDIVASQPKAKAVESLFDYRHVLLPALLLVFMLVAVLSLNMIDRSLVPL